MVSPRIRRLREEGHASDSPQFEQLHRAFRNEHAIQPRMRLCGAVFLMTRLVACIFATIACTAVSAQTSEVAYPAEDESRLGREVLELLNVARTAAGVAELEGHPDLDLLAYQHSREMAASGVVTHYSHRYGVSTETRVKLAFPRVFQFGENVALNRTVEALHGGLQASDGHRLNRLDPAFTHVGLGVAQVGRYQLFLTEVFVRVLRPALLDGIDTLYTEAPPRVLAGG